MMIMLLAHLQASGDGSLIRQHVSSNHGGPPVNFNVHSVQQNQGLGGLPRSELTQSI